MSELRWLRIPGPTRRIGVSTGDGDILVLQRRITNAGDVWEDIPVCERTVQGDLFTHATSGNKYVQVNKEGECVILKRIH